MSHYRGLQGEPVMFRGHNGDQGEAYYARPIGSGKYPGVVVIHHLPGWDEWIIEVVRKFAHHGYAAISPHLYFREGSFAIGIVLCAQIGHGAGDVTHDLRIGDPAGGAHAGPDIVRAVRRRDWILLRRPPLLSRRLHAVWNRRRGGLLGRQCHCR